MFEGLKIFIADFEEPKWFKAPKASNSQYYLYFSVQTFYKLNETSKFHFEFQDLIFLNDLY